MSTDPNLTKIAFLGTGLMGLPMAKRLQRAGYVLTVWNRTRSRAEAVGAQVEDDLERAVSDASIVITMLEDGAVVKAILEAACPAMRRGTLVVDMSSTAQNEAIEAHQLLQSKGCRFIDAPVSGGVIGAERGDLAIMVGASVEDFRAAEPVLCTMGRPTRIGPVGTGQLAKLCNQLIVGATLDIVAEALLLAQAGGADPAAVRSALRGGFAESRILEVHGMRMLDRNFIPGGQVKSQAKDMENVLAAAKDAGLQLPVAELVAAHYRSILPDFSRADQSAALLALERLNPAHRLGDADDQLP